MMNVVLLLVGMLSPYIGGEGIAPVSAGMTAPVVYATTSLYAPVQQEEQIVGYETLNGIALTDDKEEVIRKLGEPLEVTHDQILGTTDYQYEDMIVGLNNGVTEYVHVKPSAESIQVNDQSILLTNGHISASLGEPYFVAEDGDVYVQNHHAIKVFKDHGGQITGVDLFYDFSE
ncbi:hypothetical protein [Paenibacillus dakarensis]|uniref:hypothetical protein n=1 Tax=Paenibacillus dakarensis TaxID=1527293 RepID=UPI0006D58948|nr:hypothetical protein [Paenibacillus dakarensis]